MQTVEEKARAAEIMRVRKEQGVNIMEAENIVDGKRVVGWDGVKPDFETDKPNQAAQIAAHIAEEEGHAQRAHSAVVGGSSAGRVIACPGSVELSTFFPDGETSSYAEEGTALHEAIEHILTSDIEDEEIIGHTFNGYVITEELYNDAILPALEFLDDLYREFDDEVDYVTEQRVAIPEIEGAFGTVDLPMKTPDRGIVLDWKFGAGVAVAAEQNKQMMFYAHGVRSDPKTKDMFSRDKPVELIIGQPRMENGFKRWVTDHTQLDIFVKELMRAVEIARDPAVVGFASAVMALVKELYNPNADEDPHVTVHALKQGLDALNEQFPHAVFKTGDHCRWCKAKKACPVKNINANLALDETEDDLAANVSEWLAVTDDLKDWIREIEQWAFKRLEDGHTVDGWKLVAKNARRKWADEDNAFEHFSNMRSVKADEFAPRSMLSVAQMEKLLKRKKKDLPDDLVLNESSGLKMVPEDNPGESVNLTPTILEGLTDYLK